MVPILKKAWSEVLHPLLQRPNRLQVAALCYRGQGMEKQVLLITSRGTGRWILPKGWPMKDLGAGEAAMQEAWEEAGVSKGNLCEKAVGTYTYDKALDSGWSIVIDAMVFSIEVEALEDEFPEAHERRRTWVSPSEAANMVEEPGLQSILRQF
ncbi:NUDIX hydrolase [Nioella nitratireducens]|uniref:NUDIX hydrolase n=1 Tax=Nioella nitratireducens TaxID=1287720 RepID=UPI0008FD3035|nr:NUDIX hydrolase [Nioella nitratireducens]